MKKYIYIFLFLFAATAFSDFDITVESDRGWGDAQTSNIKKLCENVVLHFQEQLRDEYKINGSLTIVYHPNVPVIFLRSAFGGAPDEYQIGLAVTDRYWQQFAYQFGHEFCHIMQNYEEITPNNPNDWFHEAICEIANIWVMLEMGETWEHRPPYPNWAGWRHNLTNTANKQLNRASAKYDGTGADWLKEWEDRMRRDEPGTFTYARVSQLSYKFLPIFQENPEAWNAVRQMPASTGKMSAYMKDWYNAVDAEDKIFVEAIATEMGITVTAPVIAVTEIDADVNDDGYVDLYDVLIVRSGMNGEVSYDTDVNNDGVTDEVDLLIVKAKAVEAIAAAAPRKMKMKLTTWGSMKRR